MAQTMGRGGPDQDLAVILFSGHGEMIEGQFYLVPQWFDAGDADGNVDERHHSQSCTHSLYMSQALCIGATPAVHSL